MHPLRLMLALSLLALCLGATGARGAAPTGDTAPAPAGQGSGPEARKRPSDAEQRAAQSGEDPTAADEARHEAERAGAEKPAPEVGLDRPGGFDVYGSLRVRYRDQESVSEWQDGSSRIGANIEWRVTSGSYIYGRYEAGFNLLTGLDRLSNPGETSGEEFNETVFTRLAHAGFDTPAVNAVAGKNWSAYYKVGEFTDRFMGTGGSASGTYNAQTDGGPTGTGRADKVIQTRLAVDLLPQRIFEAFEVNVQVQHGNEIPFSDGAEYGTAIGVSAVLDTHGSLAVGVAYNHADIDLDPTLRRIGLTNDARALLLGARISGDGWYAGLVAGRFGDHETTDDGIYFDGWGSEFYGEYRMTDRVWLVGGYNVLEPDSGQAQARDYRVRYAVAGLRYSFDEFRRMVFANIRFDDSTGADGTPGSNVFTIGLRWDLSRRGWHFSK